MNRKQRTVDRRQKKEDRGQTLTSEIVLILVVLVLLPATCLQAGSIWAKRDKNMKELYADDVARQIGDILTIVISEDSKVDNKAKRDLKKDTNRSNRL